MAFRFIKYQLVTGRVIPHPFKKETIRCPVLEIQKS